jgi:phage-related protein
MKTSDFRAFSSVQLEAEIKPTDIENTSLLGRSYPRQYPLKYRFRTSSGSVKENNLLSINNRGSVFVEPILYLYGPGENILIENLTNEQKLEWLGIISEGDYIKIDCKEETIENSLGANYLEPLSSTVEWMKLEPMWNDIYITGSGFVEGVTRLKALWRAGYM